MLDGLFLGLQTVLEWHNLIFLFVGVFVGNVIGVLPGIGALAAIAMLLPVTYGLSPVGSLMMLSGIYYGASFGGATTSILLNLPGTPSHAVVCVDGHPLARNGRAGIAISIAMLASFIGVCVGILLMGLFSSAISKVAFGFGATEYFALMVLGLFAASTITNGSALKGVASVLIGLLLGVVGTDPNSGITRFDFGVLQLQDGIPLVALAMGLFAIVDIFSNTSARNQSDFVTSSNISGKSVYPTRKDLKECSGPVSRGATIGSFFGILPGTGGVIASFMSYAFEKKYSKQPEKFGQGAIEGVAGPEAANSSAAITSFIPTLTLGIPGNAVMALMLGALMIHNITPGPQIIQEQPALFWGLIVSFWLGNLLLMILNLPLIGLWTRLLKVPYRYVYPVVLILVCIGVYSENNSLFDIGVVLVIGIVGVFFKKLGFQPAPLILGFVLGPMLEENFRRSLLLSRGDLMVFFYHPVSALCLIMCLLITLNIVYKQLRHSVGIKTRTEIKTQTQTEAEVQQGLKNA